MRVILLQNIKGIGRVGEVKNVSDGYGRNYLIARKLAKPATDGAMKESEILRQKSDQLELIRQGKAKELVDAIKDMVFQIAHKANDKGTLFEGVEAEDIARVISSKLKFEVSEDMIHVNEPIKHVGKHTVEIELAPEIKTQAIIEIMGQ